jgi:hypothetical protein
LWLTGEETIHRLDNTYSSLRKAIGNIDLTKALPVDYIITCDASAELSKAVYGQAIRLISLPSA